MKPILVCLCLAALLTACAAPLAASESAATLVPEPAPSESDPLPNPPALEARYQDPAGRFGLAYPADWHVVEGEAGSRGGFVQIASWEFGSAGFESLPAGESLLQIAEYQWDPQGDLAARVAMRRTALTNSGNAVLEEEAVTLPGGENAVRMLLQDSAGNQTLVYFLVLGDSYLEISGLGDLALLEEAIRSFETLSE